MARIMSVTTCILSLSILSAGEAKTPNFGVKLLTLTYVGGKGDQALTKIAFQTDGAITATSSDEKLAVSYDATGQKCLGIKGNPDVPTPISGLRNFGVKLERKNPFDQKTWKIGLNQIEKTLQQPYLDSPNDWHWWKFPASTLHAKELMADSRGIDVFFPSADRVIAWVWRDGGNSSITRDPRDIEKPNTWVSLGGGSASYFMVGDAKTGEPRGGIAFTFRPSDACVDAGRLYVAQDIDGAADTDVLKTPGDAPCGFTVCDQNLKPLAHGRFGFGRTLAIAVKGRFLVLAGSAGNAESTDRKGRVTPARSADHLKVKNPAQTKAGDGTDGFLAILEIISPDAKNGSGR